MSFSISVVGTPQGIKRALEAESGRLSGQSKQEFDDVRPALETVLDQNVGNGVLRLDANGHATFENDKKVYGNCTVNVQVLGRLAE